MQKEKRAGRNERVVNKKGIRVSNRLIDMRCLPDSKRSQIAVFVIVAILIVAAIVLLYFFRDKIGISVLEAETPIDQIKKCMRDSVSEGISILSVQGGAISPENYYLYEDNKVDYLCYSEENYKGCVMQKPLIAQDIKTELESYAQPKVNNCFNSVKDSLEKKGYDVSSENAEVSVELTPGNIIISLENVDLTVTKGDSENYKTIKTDLNSKLYDLIMISGSIANWEARFGDSEIMTYMSSYPSIKVEKKVQDDGTKIYILTNADTSEKFIFATKSYVIPVGVTGK